MTAGDRKRFAEAMTLLAVGLDATLTSQRIALLFEDLADKPIWAVEWAAKAARRRYRFFPKAVELIELANMAPRPSGVELPVRTEPELLESTDPPEVTAKQLRDLAAKCNRKFGTRLYVGQHNGRPVMMGKGRDRQR